MINEKIKPIYIGRKTIKKIKGETVEMTPFLYVDDSLLCAGDSFGQIGIGIESSNGERLWEPYSLNRIIRLWRSLKILEILHIIEDNTLPLCWDVTDERIHEERFSTSVLSGQMGKEGFRTILNIILNSAPSQVELVGMISNLKSKGIKVNHRELQSEIDKDTITSSPVIKSVISKALRCKLGHEKAENPLPEEHRLSLFFISLGIESVQDEDGICSDFYLLYLLDQRIRHYCIGNKKIQSYLLFADENGNTKPTYLSFTGTTYVFDSVKFCKGRFYLKTKIKIPNQEETVGEYTLAELRGKIGPITLANFPKTREVFSTLITCFR